VAKIIVDKNLLMTLLNLSSVVEARDSYTGGHIWRVSEYSKLLAEKVGLKKEDILKAQLCGLVHDLGKVSTPDSILNKKGRLDDYEFEIMKAHTQTGKLLIEPHPLSSLVVDTIYNHHERIDGRGYPEGLSAQKHTLYSKIVGLADAFDAMTSERPYRSAMEKNEAINQIEEGLGLQFDRALGEKYIELAEAGSFDNVIGHFDYEKEMLSCPVCGPIISYGAEKKDGDHISCNNCSYEFKMHKQKSTFELEATNRYNPLIKSNGDKEVITQFSKAFVDRITIKKSWIWK